MQKIIAVIRSWLGQIPGHLLQPVCGPSRPSGQGMTEYIVVVAVVAVAAIGVYSMLGQTIRNQTAGIAQEISGNDAGAALNAATSSASAARSQANVRKDLKNYNQDNH